MPAPPKTAAEWRAAFARHEAWQNEVELREFHRRLVQTSVIAATDIHDEAKRLYKEGLQRIQSEPASPDHDRRNDLAEWSNDYLVRTLETRQIILNLIAVGLYHTFEQQNETFTHRLKRWPQSVRPKSPTISESVTALKKMANAIKHGKGPSESWLRTHRPDFFISPDWKRGDCDREAPDLPFEPLRPGMEGGLYVPEEQLSAWCSELVEYWKKWQTVLRDCSPSAPPRTG